jgi:hypothetical protein
MMRTALALASRGLAVFPCRPWDKRPATANGLKDATTDHEKIGQWWLTEPQFNVAIATGAVSKIFVVDVDGLDAEGALRNLEAEHGELPATVEAITARGRHLYFKTPEAAVRNTAGKIAPGLDTRGTGGYVLSPPSIHPSGRAYCWSVDCAKAFAEAPEWLLQRIAGPPNGNGRKPPASPSTWRALMAEGADEGCRNNAAASLCGYLLRRHVDAVLALEILQLWNATRCRPPLPAADIETIVNSIAGKEMTRRGYAGG